MGFHLPQRYGWTQRDEPTQGFGSPLPLRHCNNDVIAWVHLAYDIIKPLWVDVPIWHGKNWDTRQGVDK